MVVVLAVVLMMVVPVPVVVGFPVGLMRLTVMASVLTTSLHGLFEILGTVWMVVVLTEGPVVEQRITLVDAGKGAVRVLYRGTPGIVMKVVEQLGVCAPQRDTAELLSLIHISEPTRPRLVSRMPCSA